jgi:hypothetical protein
MFEWKMIVPLVLQVIRQYLCPNSKLQESGAPIERNPHSDDGPSDTEVLNAPPDMQSFLSRVFGSMENIEVVRVKRHKPDVPPASDPSSSEPTSPEA